VPYGVQIRLLRPGEPTPQVEPPNFVYTHPRGGRFEYRIDGLSGGHLLHLAVAGSVFDGIIRVARERGIALSYTLVRAEGDFNKEGTRSTGISYSMQVEGEATDDELADLAAFVRQDSSVSQIVSHGASVEASNVVTSSRK
jgi:OsmC-like protein